MRSLNVCFDDHLIVAAAVSLASLQTVQIQCSFDDIFDHDKPGVFEIIRGGRPIIESKTKSAEIGGPSIFSNTAGLIIH